MTTQRWPGISLFPFCASELERLSITITRQCIGCDYVYEAGLVENKTQTAPNHCNPEVRVFPLPLGECAVCNKPVIDGCLAFLIIVCLCTVILNSWSLAVWISLKPKRTQVYFKISLTASDLLFGLAVLPVATYHFISIMYIGHTEFYDISKFLSNPQEFANGWINYFSPAHVKFSVAILYISQGASLLSILLLSVDRHLAITKDIRYNRIMTKPRCLLLIFITWVSLVALTIILSFTVANKWTFTVSPSVFFLPLAEPPDSVDTQTYDDPIWIYLVPLILVFVATVGVTMATSCALRKPISNHHRKMTVVSVLSEGESEKITSPVAVETFQFSPSKSAAQESSSDECSSKDNAAGNSASLAAPRKSVKWSVEYEESPQTGSTLWTKFSGVFKREDFRVSRNEHQQANRTLMTILSVYAVCVLPFAILMAINLSEDDLADLTTSDGHLLRDHRSIGKLVTVGVFLTSSIWNCVIYSVRNRDFRAATRSLVAKFKSTMERYF